jgi:hypothetical protein
VNKDSVIYVDYPVLEPGAPGVMNAELGGVTRYWDGCKPSCSWVYDVVQNGVMSPHGFARQCDRNGKEMPLFYRKPPDNPQERPLISPYYAEFLGTPSACNPHNRDEWLRSQTYLDWKAENPDFPSGTRSVGYVCTADHIPYAVNDTLAYAFAASTGHCGKCFMLQFRGDYWHYDSGNARVAHKALAGKTLIIMVSNFGVGEYAGESTAFDIMIPGGGVGDYDAISEQLGFPPQPENGDGPLGRQRGGLLTECTFGNPNLSFNDIGGGFTMIEREPLDRIQECLRVKCNRAFKNNRDLLKGCLWHVDWFMAADNPDAYYKEVDCPKYLVDRYGSSFSLPTRPDDLLPTSSCNIGPLVCPAP